MGLSQMHMHLDAQQEAKHSAAAHSSPKSIFVHACRREVCQAQQLCRQRHRQPLLRAADSAAGTPGQPAQWLACPTLSTPKQSPACRSGGVDGAGPGRQGQRPGAALLGVRGSARVLEKSSEVWYILKSFFVRLKYSIYLSSLTI